MAKSKSDRKKKPAEEADREKPPKLKTAFYEDELERLQTELCKLQQWVKHTGTKAIVIFEGRDAAGKGGAIRRITERVSPRVFRTVALPAPTDREKTQMYFQRYFAHFPAAGEVVLFDRSWYNRAGVERVMGFCSESEYDNFMRVVPNLEREIVWSGVKLIKYFFDVGQDEQERRFERRIEQTLRHWKLSPMDIESYRRWWDYTQAYADMIAGSDTDYAPWYIVRADDKKRARLNCIAHLLSCFDYEELPFDKPKLPKRKPRGKNVTEPLFKNIVEDRY